MKDGYSTLVQLNGGLLTFIHEKTVTPVGFLDRGTIDTTTMRNSDVLTHALKQLYDLTDLTFKAAFGGGSGLNEALTQLQVNQEIEILFPAGFGSITFWGGLTGCVPDEHSEGNQPMVTVTIKPTLEDNDGVEREPVIVGIT
jgi:hypothetical protein